MTTITAGVGRCCCRSCLSAFLLSARADSLHGHIQDDESEVMSSAPYIYTVHSTYAYEPELIATTQIQDARGYVRLPAGTVYLGVVLEAVNERLRCTVIAFMKMNEESHP
jgi:hypothetical protein